MGTRSDSLVFVVSAHADDAERVVRPLRDRGWDVETAVRQPDEACSRIAECRPHAVVISLSGGNADDECDLACALTVAENVTDVPVLIVGGAAEDWEIIAERAPSVLFLEPEEVPWALKRLLYRH